MNQGDVILIGLRDYQDDIIMKYLADESRELKRIREISDNVNITETSTNNNDGLEDVIFNDRHNANRSSDQEESPRNINVSNSLSDDD